MAPVKRIMKQIADSELQMVAAALSFTTVLSIIPFFAVALATLQYIDGFDALYPKVEALVLNYFQGPVGNQGIEVIRKIFARIQTGRIGGLGAVALILTSAMLIFDLEKALHRIWNVSNTRPMYKRIFFYWVLLTAYPFLLAVFVALTSSKTVTSILPLGLLQVIAVYLVLVLIYKFIPAVKVPWLSAHIGASISSMGLLVLASSFRWLTHSVFNYSKVYGGITAVPALLVWILFTWYVILFGAAVTASIQRET